MSRDRFGDYSNVRRRPAGPIGLSIVPPAPVVIDEAAVVPPELFDAVEWLDPSRFVVIPVEPVEVFNDGPVS